MPGVVSFVDLPDGGVRGKAENPGTTNVFANSNCISSVGALITVTVIDPPPAGGYTIMWQATMSKNNTTTSYLGNQSYMVFTVIIDGDWTGEVVFDGYYQIQSFTSIGTVNRKEVDRRVFEECGRESVHEFVHTSTTTGPGLLPIQLNIVRGNDSQGSYIYDPFLGLNNPAGYFNVPSSISYTIDVTGYSGCGDNVQPADGHFGDSFAENTFGFETVPGVLRPTTSDPTMFMKSNTVTYSDTKTVTWDIIVIVSP